MLLPRVVCIRDTLYALAAVAGATAVAAEPLSQPPADWWRPPAVRAFLDPPTSGTAASPSSFNRFPLFRMPPGFLRDPIGVEDDDPQPRDRDGRAPGEAPGADDPDPRVQVSFGTDNPYFDFRSAADPGGVGYYRLCSQYQLSDDGRTSVALALQAWTPAGREDDGAAGGPTVLRPALAWFHQIDDSLAIHGFVGKSLRADNRWLDSLEYGYHCGLALQTPLTGPSPNQGVHMFVEALGRYRWPSEWTARPVPTLEILPGIHWRVGENWWLTSGVVLPAGGLHSSNELWQFTFWWRF